MKIKIQNDAIQSINLLKSNVAHGVAAEGFCIDNSLLNPGIALSQHPTDFTFTTFSTITLSLTLT